MKLVAVACAGEDVDVVERSVRWHLASGVAHVVVADAKTADGTRDVLADLARTEPVTVLDDPDPAYRPGDRWTRACERAFDALRPTWILPFELGALWTLPASLPRIGEPVLTTTVLDHVCTTLDDEGDPNPFTRLRWRRPPSGRAALVRWRRGYALSDAADAVRGPRGEPLAARAHDGLVLRRFRARSAAQWVRASRAAAAALLASARVLGARAAEDARRALERIDADPSRLEAGFRGDHVVSPGAPLVLDPVAWPAALDVRHPRSPGAPPPVVAAPEGAPAPDAPAPAPSNG